MSKADRVRALKAHVHNGQLVLDESATDLAEGTEAQLVVLTPDFEPAERERLLKSLALADDEIEAGEHADGFEFIAGLRAARETEGR